MEDILLVCFDNCHELTTEQGCLMWGTRVVIPKVHQQKVQEELHGGHLGVGKMKALARSQRRIHVDLARPFQGKSFLVIVDAYSK